MIMLILRLIFEKFFPTHYPNKKLQGKTHVEDKNFITITITTTIQYQQSNIHFY